MPLSVMQVVGNSVIGGAEHFEELHKTQRRLRAELKPGTGPRIGTVSQRKSGQKTDE
jgi:hypothetical protein